MQSFFWYDLETFGRDARYDRIAQFAGIRTDADLNIIDEPVACYCQPSPDYLPDPEACLITGITPDYCLEHGLSEADFAARIEQCLGAPGTCGVGYNSLRFDDEFVRHLLFRNLYDPYAREWQNGNSRWDLLDVVRAVRALRPGSINWPSIDGKPSNRLEAISAANGLEHQQAHDALSDVIATIDVARLLKTTAPKLFDYALALRNKHEVTKRMEAAYGHVLLHVSGRAAASSQHCALITPVAPHPQQKQAWIVVDLSQPIDDWFIDDADLLRQRLYSTKAELGDQPRPAVKVIRANRCPFIAPTAVLGEREQALGLDLARAKTQLATLNQAHRSTLQQVFNSEAPEDRDADIEASLYRGFIPNSDRARLQRARETVQYQPDDIEFHDPRLSELYWRYIARNHIESLDQKQLAQWMQFCKDRLTGQLKGARSVDEFDAALALARQNQDEPAQQKTLMALQNFREQLCGYLGI